jgi:hypothetical protein
MPLAYLPEHVWQVGAGAMAVVMTGLALLHLVGRLEPRSYVANAARVRWAGGLAVALGIGLAVAAVLVNAEPPGPHGGDQWGGSVGVVALVIWVILLALSAAASSRRRGRG